MSITETVIEKAKAIVESRLEYEETHIDAGDAYSHLASEGDFDYHNGESRLVEYCQEMGIDLTGIEIGRLAEDVIFWSRMESQRDYDPAKPFLVASYQIGEIEIQVDSSEIGLKPTHWVIDKLNRNTDGYWTKGGSDCFYVYIVSDRYWDQICDLDVIRGLVKQHKDN
jgi:hypothetical protein